MLSHTTNVDMGATFFLSFRCPYEVVMGWWFPKHWSRTSLTFRVVTFFVVWSLCMARTGRPPNWKTPEELQKEIDLYFEKTPEEQWTITGLALFLDTSRQTLMEYQEKDNFADTLKRAKLRIENVYEVALRKNGNAGNIFALKNFGWRDRHEIGGPNGSPLQVNIMKYEDADDNDSTPVQAP